MFCCHNLVHIKLMESKFLKMAISLAQEPQIKIELWFFHSSRQEMTSLCFISWKIEILEIVLMREQVLMICHALILMNGTEMKHLMLPVNMKWLAIRESSSITIMWVPKVCLSVCNVSKNIFWVIEVCQAQLQLQLTGLS